ncbi:serine protease [Roseibium sp. RKSG952]|uniref:trypsin-like serine peptidase n=1 Tax=Roseibium sp. RKSG952 TaxID=2529384 RepID=UPI0012BB7955|nr:serine protease [Roseibium sp. RKSG952]MTI03210.1 serine protease [Roseibium sp. RKSG952]
MRTLSILAALVTLAPYPTELAGAECSGSLITELGTVYTVTDTQVSAQTKTDVKRHPAAAGTLRYMRLQLTRNGSEPADWRVHLREPNTGRVLQRFGPSDLEPGKSVWSDRLQLSEVLVTFEPIGPENADPGDVKVIVTSYFAMPTVGEFHFYSAVDPDRPAWGDLHDQAPSDRWRYLGDSIGILISRAAGKASTCTGAMVGEGLFLTNWHCGALAHGGDTIEDAYWDEAAVCNNALIDFSWDDDAISDDFSCVSVPAQSKSLDYALLEIESVNGTASVQPLRIVPDRLPQYAPIHLIHHPRAMSKKISLDCRMVTDEAVEGWVGGHADSEFLHRCDTEGGSSGAPFLDDDGNVRALHHLGFDLNSHDCTPVAGPRGNHNKAVWMDSILSDLSRHGINLSEAGYLLRSLPEPD